MGFRAPLILAALLGCSTPPAPRMATPDRPAAAFFDETMALFQARKYERARDGFQLVAYEADRQGDARVEVEACAMVARCYSIERNLPQGEFWLERARELATPTEARGWARYQVVLGIFQRARGDRESAAETFSELYAYCRERGMLQMAIDAAHHAAIVATGEDQVTWGRKGLAAARDAGEERWQAVLWNNLGMALDGLERYPEMLEAYEQARHFHARTGGEREVLLADWALARALRLNGQLDRAWASQQDVLRRAEERQTREPGRANHEWVAYSLWELGELAIARADAELARASFERCLAIMHEVGLRQIWPDGVAQVEALLAGLGS
ncbi:MAG: tetratricopeptide repeat protein [Planctomycetota bacterium]|nr:tetratricopeptide repeat protein [Planctomycetota bacterium]